MRRELDGRSRRSSTGSACRVCAAALITPEGQRNPIHFDADQHTRSLTSCLLSSGDRTAISASHSSKACVVSPVGVSSTSFAGPRPLRPSHVDSRDRAQKGGITSASGGDGAFGHRQRRGGPFAAFRGEFDTIHADVRGGRI